MESKEDNLYGFQEDTPDAFDIAQPASPNEAIDVVEQSVESKHKEESVPEASSTEASLIGEKEPAQQEPESIKEGCKASSQEESVSGDKTDEPSQETSSSQEDNVEKSDADAEAEAKVEVEEDEDEYDPTAEAEAQAEAEAEDSKSLENDDDDEDAYDPTADLTADSKITSVTNASVTSASSTPQLASASTNTQSNSSTVPPGIDPKIASELSQRLFSDPEFLKLSYDQQQKRVLEEFTRLSQSTVSSTPASTHVESTHRPNFELAMTIEERNDYNAHLDNEAKYNSRYPYKANSRLFVGNLPANFSKENLFRMFRAYGKILQISIKNSYSFIQFEEAPSVVKAIETEFGVSLYGKDLVLEIAKNSRPETLQNPGASVGPLQGSTADSGLHGNKFFESRKRAREEYLKGNVNSSSSSMPFQQHEQSYGFQSHRNDNSSQKKRRHHQVDCQILIKPSSDPVLGKETSRMLNHAGINTEYEYLKNQHQQDKKMSDAAYSGVLGVVLVNRNRSLDLFHYEKNPDGGIKYDEYNSISPNEVVTILKNAKSRQGAGSSSPYQSHPNPNLNPYSRNKNPYNQPHQAPLQQDANTLLQTLQNVNPQQLQTLLALAGNLQQPQQPQYGQPQYNQFQQSQQNLGNVDLASLISKLQPQGSPPPPQNHAFNQYNPSEQNYGQSYGNRSGYQHNGSGYQPHRSPQPQPQQQQQQPPPPQQPPQQSGGSNIQALLQTLSNFQK